MKDKEVLLYILIIFLILKLFICEYKLYSIENKYKIKMFNFKNKLVNKGIGKWKLNNKNEIIFIIKGEYNGKF